MFRKLAVATVAALVITGLAAAPSVASAPTPSGDDRLAVYSGTVDAAGYAAIVDLGVDRGEIVTTPSADGSGLIDVQVILSGSQVAGLAAGGTELQIQADPGAQRRMLKEAEPEGVFRMYSGDGGILDGAHGAGRRAPRHRRVPRHRQRQSRVRRSARCA